MSKHGECFTVSLDIYPSVILVSLGQSDSSFTKAVKRFNPSRLHELDGIPVTRGRCTILSDNSVVIRLRDYPQKPSDFGCLAHEIFHAAFGLLEIFGVKPSSDSEEAYAYLIGYITSSIYKQIN